MPRVALGSAQFGMEYGVTNGLPMPSLAQIEQILRQARLGGVTHIDTAPSYGNAEARLGLVGRSMSVGTKVKGGHTGGIQKQLQESLVRLGTSTLSQVLIHDWCQISSVEMRRSAAQLEAARSAGMVERVGVSVYTPESLLLAGQHFAQLDTVQVPFSALDRRFREAVGALRDRHPSLEVEGRSALLQGVLGTLQGPDGLGDHDDVRRWREWCQFHALSPSHAALAYVFAQQWIDRVVVGVASPSQLTEVLDIHRDQDGTYTALGSRVENEIGPSSDLNLIDPSRW